MQRRARIVYAAAEGPISRASDKRLLRAVSEHKPHCQATQHAAEQAWSLVEQSVWPDTVRQGQAEGRFWYLCEMLWEYEKQSCCVPGLERHTRNTLARLAREARGRQPWRCSRIVTVDGEEEQSRSSAVDSDELLLEGLLTFQPQLACTGKRMKKWVRVLDFLQSRGCDDFEAPLCLITRFKQLRRMLKSSDAKLMSRRLRKLLNQYISLLEFHSSGDQIKAQDELKPESEGIYTRLRDRQPNHSNESKGLSSPTTEPEYKESLHREEMHLFEMNHKENMAMLETRRLLLDRLCDS